MVMIKEKSLAPILKHVPASIRKIMAPDVKLSLLEWTEKRRYVPKKPFRGTFSNETMPLCKGFYEEFDKDRFLKFVLLASTQSGKTEMGVVNPLLYKLDSNEDTGLAFPTKDILKSFWNSKVAPSLVRMPDVFPKFPAHMKKDGLKSMLLKGACDPFTLEDGNTFFPIWAGSESRMSSASIPVIIMDEIGKFETERASSGEGTPIDQIIERSSAFEDGRKIVLSCTLTTENSRIYQEYKNGTEGICMVPCPKCGKWIAFEFDGNKTAKFFPKRPNVFTTIKYDDENEVIAQETARLECPFCQHGIDNQERLEALSQSTWVHDGQEIDKQGRVTGEFKGTKTYSIRWNKLYFPGRSLGSQAAEHMAAYSGSDLAKKKFQIYTEALPWEEDLVTKEVTRELLTRLTKNSNYQKGFVPDEDYDFLTMGADVQGFGVYWIVIAHRLADQAMAIVDFGVIGDEDSKRKGTDPTDGEVHNWLQQLHQIMEEGWPVQNQEVIMKPVLRGIDVGYRQPPMMEWIKRVGLPWCAVKGTDGWKGGRPTGTKDKGKLAIEGVIDPRRQDKGGLIWFVWSKEVRKSVHNGYLIPPGEPGHHSLPFGLDKRTSDGGSRWVLHHIASWKLETKDDPVKGYIETWKKINRNDHLLAALTYGYALGVWESIRKKKMAVLNSIPAVQERPKETSRRIKARPLNRRRY